MIVDIVIISNIAIVAIIIVNSGIIVYYCYYC